jgi:predicted RNA-binding Zn-ribbon protein involved in translation (DUF1610 family)
MKPSASNSVLSVSSVVQPEVISPQQSAAILDRCEKQITSGIDHLQGAEKTCDGWRFFLGLQVRTAKPHLEHGAFEPWIENKWKIDHRTANNWVRFAECIVVAANARIEAGEIKRETVSLLLDAPQKVANGGIAEREIPTVLDLVRQVTGGQPMMQFIKAHTEKPARKISFHCPHCGTENTGFIGRDITCINRECGETITVKETTTPEEQIQAAIKDAEDLVKAAISSLRIVREHKHRHDISTDLLRALIDESIETNKEAKSILKKRKQKKGTSREGAKSAKGKPTKLNERSNLHAFYAYQTRYSDHINIKPHDLEEVIEACKSPSVVWVLRHFEASSFDEAQTIAAEEKKKGHGMDTYAAKGGKAK